MESKNPCYMCGDTGIQGPEQGVTFGGGTCCCEAGKTVQAKRDANVAAGCTCTSRSDKHSVNCKLFVDHADELGKVWDALHASEGVRMLIEKLRASECQHDWFAPFGCRTMQCSKCDATRSAV